MDIDKQLLLDNYKFLKEECLISSIEKMLRFLRRNLRITQSEMASILHISRYTVARYETRKKKITENEAEFYAIKLGLPIDEFIKLTKENKDE